MIFVTGPMFSGKEDWVTRTFRWDRETFQRRAVRDAELLVRTDGIADAAELDALADRLAANDVVIASEIGAGVVPADAAERIRRENAGRLACLLAGRADAVVRICCGLPQILKGTVPEEL